MLCQNKMIAASVLFLSFLVGCTPARQGAIENGFIATGIVTPIEITVNAPLILVGAGKQTGTIKSDVNFSPAVPMQYAVFASPKNQKIRRHAYTFIATLPSDRWKFSMESWERPLSLELAKRSIAKRNFTVQTFIIADENDWFSQLREKNEKTPSPAWVARRFSYSPKPSVRVVAEYREPIAECLKSYIRQRNDQKELKFTSSDRQIIWGNCYKDLNNFTERSDAVFSIEKPKETQVIKETTPLQLPSSRPDISKLAGDAEYLMVTPRF